MYIWIIGVGQLLSIISFAMIDVWLSGLRRLFLCGEMSKTHMTRYKL